MTKSGGHHAAQHPNQFAQRDRPIPWSGKSEQRLSGISRDTQTLLQALRPYPQWNGIHLPWTSRWETPGMTRFRSKRTQRFSHGLSAQMAYTWQKELTNGTNSNTSYVTPSPPLINDVFNIGLNKQISGFQHSAGDDYCVQLHDAQAERPVRRGQGAVRGWRGTGPIAGCSVIKAAS